MGETIATASESEFVLLTLDEKSLSLQSQLDPEEVAGSRALQLMAEGYPWSREVYALAAQRLLDAGARLVIFDMLFPSPREGDDAFARVLEANPGRIVIGSNFETSPSGRGRIEQLTPPTEKLNATTTVGFVNFPQPSDGVIRSMWPYATESVYGGNRPRPEETIFPALSTAAANLLGKQIPVSFRKLRFAYAKWGFFKFAPFYEIFVPSLWKSNYENKDFFRNRVVLIGATAQNLQDFHITPLGRIPGPVLQLHVLSALLHNNWLYEAGTGASTCFTLLAGGLACALIMLRRNLRWLIFGLMAGAIFWIALCAISLVWFAFFLPVAPPLLTWLVCGFAGLACDVSIERSERRRLRSTLERYVSRDVVREIVENPASYLNTLAGQRKDACVLFSDLQGFTSSSENLDPAELVAQLNEYFSEMVSVVFQHHGTFDKTIGDALMAEWGCMTTAGPSEDAKRGLRAAFDMKRRLVTLNMRRAEKGLAPWGCGIGLCHGSLIFGNIGSHERADSTAIGDTVNLASRIEGLTRMYGCDTLINEQMASLVEGEFGLLLVDRVRVKGRKQPVELYFPFELEEKASHAGWIGAFVAARELYASGDFAAAAAAFEKLSSEGLAPKIAWRFTERCRELTAAPPTGWEGVWTFTEK